MFHVCVLFAFSCAGVAGFFAFFAKSLKIWVGFAGGYQSVASFGTSNAEFFGMLQASHAFVFGCTDVAGFCAGFTSRDAAFVFIVFHGLSFLVFDAIVTSKGAWPDTLRSYRILEISYRIHTPAESSLGFCSKFCLTFLSIELVLFKQNRELS